MSKSYGIVLFIPLFWVMSPEALVLIGNSAGQSRELFFFAVGVGLIVSAATVSLHQHPKLPAERTDLFLNTLDTLGPLPTITFTLSSCLSLAVFLPTGVLVSAGFTFNETFVYWFPNFGFSFFLLFMILALHLAGQRYVRTAQKLFLLICFLSLLIIIFFGIFNKPSGQLVTPVKPLDFSTTISAVGTALILFIGHHYQSSPIRRSTLYLSLFITTLFIFFWGGISLKFVGPVKLSESSIPYVLASREILGQTGRCIIGVAVISGACALVNAIFLLSTNILVKITEQCVIMSTAKTEVLKKLYPILFTAFIAISLANGLAGSEYIDTYIYSALLLWMLLLGLHCFAATILVQKIINSKLPHYLFISLVYPAAALYLAVEHHHTQRIAILCFLIIFISFLFSISCNILRDKWSLIKTNPEKRDKCLGGHS